MSTESVLEVKLAYGKREKERERERERDATREMTGVETAAGREYGINSVKIYTLHCNSSRLSR